MASSPSNIDTPLEYITVESYAWPKPERAKRFRQDDEVRKIKHRENQRRFMQRKQERISIARRELEFIELQFKYLQALQEEQTLRKERRQLDALSSEKEEPDVHCKRGSLEPLEARESLESIELDSILSEITMTL